MKNNKNALYRIGLINSSFLFQSNAKPHLQVVGNRLQRTVANTVIDKMVKTSTLLHFMCRRSTILQYSLIINKYMKKAERLKPL
jgi:hypothetical protein